MTYFCILDSYSGDDVVLRDEMMNRFIPYVSCFISDGSGGGGSQKKPIFPLGIQKKKNRIPHPIRTCRNQSE